MKCIEGHALQVFQLQVQRFIMMETRNWCQGNEIGGDDHIIQMQYIQVYRLCNMFLHILIDKHLQLH